MSRKTPRLPIEGEAFFLTSPFIDQAIALIDRSEGGWGVIGEMAILQRLTGEQIDKTLSGMRACSRATTRPSSVSTVAFRRNTWWTVNITRCWIF